MDGEFMYNLPFFSKFNWYPGDDDVYAFLARYFGKEQAEDLYVSDMTTDWTEEHGTACWIAIFSICAKFHGFRVPFTTVCRVRRKDYDKMMEAPE